MNVLGNLLRLYRFSQVLRSPGLRSAQPARLVRSVWRRPLAVVAVVPLVVALLFASGQLARAAQGAEPLDAWLAKAGAAASLVGVDVRSLDDGLSLLQRDPARLLNPASSIKLLTTYAALLLLGEDFRWQTQFRLDGELVDGVLNGDLVMKGGGDPKLVIEDLEVVIAQMRAAGLSVINGDLRIDNSLYATAPNRAASFDGQAAQPYNVWPDAAMLNFKSTKFVVTPSGNKAMLKLDPSLAGVKLENQIRLVSGRCRHRASGLQVRSRTGSQGSVLRVSGSYSRRCGQGHAFHAVLDHVRFSEALFRAAWEQAGGRWSGRARRAEGADVDSSAAFAGTPAWLTWLSPRTLANIVSDINKFSNNVMTRQLMLQMAVENGSAGDAPMDEASARRLVLAILRLNGLVLSGAVLDNGSGLSRRVRISAQGLTELLLHAARGPHADTLRESLPIVGVDGTMRRRLRKHPVAGKAWIKTGSLSGVRSMAGYVSARSGKRYALSLIVNGPGARASRTVQDSLIRWVYENG